MQPYLAMLESCGVVQGVSRKGNCFDNAVIESFFVTFKAEYIHLAPPNSVDDLETGLHDNVQYYNHERIKLGLQEPSPVQYRRRGDSRTAAS